VSEQAKPQANLPGATSKIYKPPQVDAILQHPLLAEWRSRVEGKVLTKIIRAVIEERRSDYLEEIGNAPEKEDRTKHEAQVIAQKSLKRLEKLSEAGLRPVINGTGIVINTNLGRAPLPQTACNELMELLSGYCNLELDLETGKRGERNSFVELVLAMITGCQSAIVVNNNAAAVMLAIATLARDKEVIVSRGELVEIGGSFRLPDVISGAGGRLKEVGTTNRTRLSDYESAITRATGVILKCHQSNFEMRGFVEEASVKQLAELSQRSGIPLLEDLGSGSLFDLEKVGLREERTVQDSVSDGASITLFSGDKLFGGPQAGFIIGRKQLVSVLHSNPLYRALRPDKFLIALVESVLKLYLLSDKTESIPVLAMASEQPPSIRARVYEFIDKAKSACPKLYLRATETESALGGGTSPGQRLASFAVSVKAAENVRIGSEKIATLLRQTKPIVIGRLQNDEVLVDFRTVLPRQELQLLNALQQLETMLI